MSARRRSVAAPSGPSVHLHDCDHGRCVPPNGFDAARAATLSPREVRAAFPRFFGRCPDCGDEVPAYASYEHYAAGEW